MEQQAIEAPHLDDFSDFETVQTKVVRIKTKDGPTSIQVTLAGPEHPDRKKLVWARQRKMRSTFVATGKMPVSDPQEDEVEKVDYLVACTLHWDGARTPFSKEAARALYSDPKRTHIRDQVQKALDDEDLFTQRSATA